MASVFFRDGSWYLRVKDAAGRWTKKRSSVKTKTEAKRMAYEIEMRAERQRLGVEAKVPSDGGEPLGEMLQWWLREHSKGTPSHAWQSRVVKKHIMPTKLARLPVFIVQTENIEALLAKKEREGLAAQTVNHIRSI